MDTEKAKAPPALTPDIDPRSPLHADRIAGAYAVLRERTGLLALVAIGAPIGAWALSYLFWPFGVDHGLMQWVGDVVRGGGLPYRDAWEVRGPLYLYFWAALVSMFGEHIWLYRFIDLCLQASAAWMIGQLARPFAGATGARWAAGLYLLWYASLDFDSTMEVDGLPTLLLTGVALAISTWGTSAPFRAAVVAGMLLGACALVKPQYAGFLALPACYALASRPGDISFLARFLLATVAAFLVPIAITLGWFASQGALSALIDAHLLWALSAYTDFSAGWFSRLHAVLDFMGTGRALAAVPLVAVGIGLTWRTQRPVSVLLIAWTVLGIGSVAMQGRFVASHWQPIYPPLTILAGIGARGLIAASRAWRACRVEPAAMAGRVIPVALLGLAIGTALQEPILHVFRSSMLLVGRSGAEVDAIAFGAFGRTSRAVPAIGAYIAARTTPDDAVLVWGLLPSINVASDRRSPTRFGHFSALAQAGDSPHRRRYRQEFLERLRAAPPAYVLAFDDRICAVEAKAGLDFSLPPGTRAVGCLEKVPGLWEFVIADYTLETTMLDHIDLWRRR